MADFLTKIFRGAKRWGMGTEQTQDSLVAQQLKVFQELADEKLAPELQRLYSKYHPLGTDPIRLPDRDLERVG